jgi:hypothetical protein
MTIPGRARSPRYNKLKKIFECNGAQPARVGELATFYPTRAYLTCCGCIVSAYWTGAAPRAWSFISCRTEEPPAVACQALKPSALGSSYALDVCRRSLATVPNREFHQRMPRSVFLRLCLSDLRVPDESPQSVARTCWGCKALR